MKHLAFNDPIPLKLGANLTRRKELYDQCDKLTAKSREMREFERGDHPLPLPALIFDPVELKKQAQEAVESGQRFELTVAPGPMLTGYCSRRHAYFVEPNTYAEFVAKDNGLPCLLMASTDGAWVSAGSWTSKPMQRCCRVNALV